MALFISFSARCRSSSFLPTAAIFCRHLKSSTFLRESHDPRVEDIGRAIEDDYATIRAKYREYLDHLSVWITVDGLSKKPPKTQSS